jgi:hypothetical protein
LERSLQKQPKDPEESNSPPKFKPSSPKLPPAFALAVAFLAVIPEGDLLFAVLVSPKPQ